VHLYARRHSYALAGLVSGTSLIAAVLIVPRISRLIDRYGQSRAAVPATVFSVVFSVLQVVCVRNGAPEWTLFATAVLSATAPNAGGMVRARWAELLKDEPDVGWLAERRPGQFTLAQGPAGRGGAA
jgi:MFS-type transporter involved in bile tolerance (Atg22 family)